MGDAITEADVRLFTTLVRFDAVYHGHFKCNRNKLTEMPVLWAYARDLFQTPGFGDTVDFDHIKRHYYATHAAINPTLIVPVGPDPSGWTAPMAGSHCPTDPPINHFERLGHAALRFRLIFASIVLITSHYPSTPLLYDRNSGPKTTRGAP